MDEKPDYSGITREHLEAKLWDCQKAYSLIGAENKQLIEEQHVLLRCISAEKILSSLGNIGES